MVICTESSGLCVYMYVDPYPYVHICMYLTALHVLDMVHGSNKVPLSAEEICIKINLRTKVSAIIVLVCNTKRVRDFAIGLLVIHSRTVATETANMVLVHHV